MCTLQGACGLVGSRFAAENFVLFRSMCHGDWMVRKVGMRIELDSHVQGRPRRQCAGRCWQSEA